MTIKRPMFPPAQGVARRFIPDRGGFRCAVTRHRASGALDGFAEPSRGR